jgi:hypothetical protein
VYDNDDSESIIGNVLDDDDDLLCTRPTDRPMINAASAHAARPAFVNAATMMDGWMGKLLVV